MNIGYSGSPGCQGQVGFEKPVAGSKKAEQGTWSRETGSRLGDQSADKAKAGARKIWIWSTVRRQENKVEILTTKANRKSGNKASRNTSLNSGHDRCS